MASRVTEDVVDTRFQLPVLHFDSGSIADGTGIPPPEVSIGPYIHTPPQTPSTKDGSLASQATVSPEESLSRTNGQRYRLHRSAETPPHSPYGSVRPSRFRRLFTSGTTMSNSYADKHLVINGSASMYDLSRPDGQSGASLVDEQKSKRASNWFRRLRSADSRSKRWPSFFGVEELPITSQKPFTSPPPVIPDLLSLAKDKDGFGDDLFKHIK